MISDEVEGHSAIVVVEHGRIELECGGGSRQVFERGDIFYLAGLSVRRLRNPDHDPAVLIAVSRASRGLR